MYIHNGEVILNDHPDVPYVQYKSLLIIANSSMIIMASQQKHEFHAGWWFETWILFSIIYGIIHQPLTFIFFKMVQMVGGYKSSPNGRWHGVDATWYSHWIPWISKNGDLIGFHLGKFHHDRTLFSGTLEIMVRIWGIIPKWPNNSG